MARRPGAARGDLRGAPSTGGSIAVNQLRKLNSEKGIAAQGAGDAYLSGARVLSSSPISVALVLDHASVTGGAAKVAFDSALGLRQAGHRPIVFAAAGPIDPRLTEEGVEVVCLGQHDILNDPSRLGAAARGIWNFEAARRLEALLASLPRGRSLVHVHGWAKALSPSIARPDRRLRTAGGLHAARILPVLPQRRVLQLQHERSLPDSSRCRAPASPRIATRAPIRKSSGVAQGIRP